MRLLLIFFLLFIISCGQKQDIPPGILPQSKMQAVLWDMLRADEFVLNFERNDSSRTVKDKSTLLYEKIFTIHQITKSQFEKSVTFYSQHPDLFKVVLDSMEKQKTAIITESYRPRLSDSFRLKKPVPHGAGKK
jgi:ribosomal protein S8